MILSEIKWYNKVFVQRQSFVSSRHYLAALCAWNHYKPPTITIYKIYWYWMCTKQDYSFRRNSIRFRFLCFKKTFDHSILFLLIIESYIYCKIKLFHVTLAACKDFLDQENDHLQNTVEVNFEWYRKKNSHHSKRLCFPGKQRFSFNISDGDYVTGIANIHIIKRVWPCFFCQISVQ